MKYITRIETHNPEHLVKLINKSLELGLELQVYSVTKPIVTTKPKKKTLQLKIGKCKECKQEKKIKALGMCQVCYIKSRKAEKAKEPKESFIPSEPSLQ